MTDRADTVGTIEYTRRMLAFLETLSNPSEAAQDLVRRYRAEIEAFEYGRMSERDPEETGSHG